MAAIWVLLGWNVFVWGSRIRNVWVDESLSTDGQLLRTGLSVVFLVGSAVAASGLLRSQHWGRRALAVFSVWTVGFWLVRATQIALADHSVGFIVVHVLLGVVSISLVAWAWNATSVPREAPARVSAR